MRASGVYWTLTDQSLRAVGSTNLTGVVAMLTNKGKFNELNRVTADNIEDVVGYDLSYNADYRGLEKMLEHVPYLYVMRLNSGAKVANIYDTSTDTLDSVEGLEEDTSLEDLETTFSVQAKTAGECSNYYFKILPVTSTQNLAVPAVDEDKYKISFKNEIDMTRLAFSVSGVKYAIGIYNSARTQLYAVGNSDGKLLQVTNGVASATEVGTFTDTGLEITASLLPLPGAAISVEAFDKTTQLYNFYFATSDDGANYYTGEIYNGVPVKRLCIIPTSDLEVSSNDWKVVPGSAAVFDSPPSTILRTSTTIGASVDTLPRDPFNYVGIRFTLPGTTTTVRVASLADYKWVANRPLFVDYI